MTTERTALYRLFDHTGVLLYVGVAARPESRWTQHAAEKDWWPEVRRYEVEWLDDRESALTAEKLAMVDERPRHNIACSPWRPEIDPLTGECTMVPRAGPATLRSIRVPDDDWALLGEATRAIGTDRAKVLNAYIAWHLRRPGAKLPERPTVEQVRNLTADDA